MGTKHPFTFEFEFNLATVEYMPIHPSRFVQDRTINAVWVPNSNNITLSWAQPVRCTKMKYKDCVESVESPIDLTVFYMSKASTLYYNAATYCGLYWQQRATIINLRGGVNTTAIANADNDHIVAIVSTEMGYDPTDFPKRVNMFKLVWRWVILAVVIFIFCNICVLIVIISSIRAFRQQAAAKANYEQIN